MKWSEICIHTTHEAVEPVSNILHEAGSSGVVIEDSEDLKREWPEGTGEIYELNPDDYPEEGVNVKAYLQVNSFLGETVETIKASINNLLLYDIDVGPNEITLTEVREEDWATAWKKYYKPVKITDRITITPTWETYEAESQDDLIIELDPGMAFGTGTHPTTVLCIQALEKYLQPRDKMLDVGTGSGVLSIAAAKLGSDDILAVDLDDVAVKSAKQNIKGNKADDVVTVKQNNLVDHIKGPYDFIVGNLLADIVIRMSEGVASIIKPGGIMVTSGIIQNKKDQVIQALRHQQFTVIETMEQEDWVALVVKYQG
ncbi:50S ribosomal protein L11 methyltransferase [Tuberibacillus sp. Marseille-P3662]|uniref:50S ribosomal protein L11 methyltransferase n=1 Tax=Tuberibacillus sp. Marseille-P3662 TaxID=1965358 RepID=UPI000A1CEEE2|nr:50S ribosomal protein L11 methyltransferase [Tuberibacillus sp. Marseille-P3662]